MARNISVVLGVSFLWWSGIWIKVHWGELKFKTFVRFDDLFPFYYLEKWYRILITWFHIPSLRMWNGYNILLILYCWTIVQNLALDCSHPLSRIAVQICSIMTLGCFTLIDLSRSTGTFSAGSQWSKRYELMKHVLEFTFHCILMVLELNLVKYLLCGPF